MANKRRKSGDQRSSQDKEFTWGPVHVRQRGTNVEIKSNATPEQFAAMRATLLEWRSNAPEEFRKEAEELLAALRDTDPLSVLGVVFFSRYLAPMMAGKPMKDSFAIIEHVAMLLAKDEATRKEPPHKLVLDGPEGDLLHTYVDHHLMSAMQVAFPDPREDPEMSDTLAECIVNVVGWEMVVRVPRYDHQQKALLRALFDPFEDVIRSSIGFACSDAMLLESAFIDRIQDTTNEGTEVTRSVLRDFDRASRGISVDNKEALSLLALARERKAGDPAQFVRIMLAMWMGFRTGASMAMRQSQIQVATGLTDATVANMLKALTTTHRDLCDYTFAVPMSPLKSKPLVRLSGAYVLPSLPLFLPALQNVFESALKQSTEWHRYELHRKEYAEARAGELFSRLLPGARVLPNRKYPGGELDVLVAFERRLFLVEVKGGGFAARARVGIAKLLLSNLRALVTKAYEQSDRALTYVMSAEEVTFKSDDGEVTIRQSDFDHVHRVAVTLEQIGHVVNGFGSALLSSAGNVAWTIALDDLETISDVLARPALFIHYLTRREAILNMPNIENQDELGFLEWYLRTSLAKIGSEYDGQPRVSLDPSSTTIDAFEQAKARGEEVKTPQVSVPPQLLRLLDGLSTCRSPNWVDASLALLNMPHKLQRSLARQMRKAEDGGGKSLLRVRSDDGLLDVAVQMCKPNNNEPIPTGWVIRLDDVGRVTGIRAPSSEH